MFILGGPLMLFGVGASGEEASAEVPELVGGGGGRKRSKVRRIIGSDGPLVPITPETISANVVEVVGRPHEIAVLIKKAQENDEEALAIILAEVM